MEKSIEKTVIALMAPARFCNTIITQEKQKIFPTFYQPYNGKNPYFLHKKFGKQWYSFAFDDEITKNSPCGKLETICEHFF